MITTNDKIVCGFDAGKHRYGEKRKDILSEGIYVAMRDIKSSKWENVQGVYDNISALMIGIARYYSDKEKETLYKHAREIIGEEFKHPNLPIVANMDFGHTDPQFILPLGVEAEVDCKRRTFRLTECPLK